jgi:hypothetical protein
MLTLLKPAAIYARSRHVEALFDPLTKVNFDDGQHVFSQENGAENRAPNCY